jgi:2-dehydropantoate 2-reductase
MGVIDEVNEKVFPNVATRPRYIEGMTSHSLRNHTSKTFTTLHFGSGGIFLAAQGHNGKSFAPGDGVDSTMNLLRSLTRSSVLNAKGISPNDLLVLKLERLAIEAVIGPLSVMFDCNNGGLLGNYRVSQLLREILKEISMVILALPELKNFPELRTRIHHRELEKTFVRVATMTSSDVHDMVQSVRMGKKSEVDYFTGYILKRASQLGIDCPANRMMDLMVKAKTVMRSQEASGFIPFRRDG